jgi:hypothetical protein
MTGATTFSLGHARASRHRLLGLFPASSFICSQQACDQGKGHVCFPSVHFPILIGPWR